MGILGSIVGGASVLTRSLFTLGALAAAFVFRSRLSNATKFITLTAFLTYGYANIVMPDDYDFGVGDLALAAGASTLTLTVKQ